ncbi:copper amine oxidase N-terminal domain-containing protein [Cohnella ginsengisoli]|uniref:copper amine oxidase N-terminal domain-containing protein n=1 Tax=Cohnella ginsengisoli TaxID=425004 RepID=UPI0030B904C8
MNLFINGDETIPAVAPIIRDGSTLVPFRAIAEALRAEVVYNAADHTVTVTRDGISVKLVLNSKTAYVNGKTVKLEVSATVVKGSTVVPVRFVSEALDSTVKWEPVSQSVVIYDNP